LQVAARHEWSVPPEAKPVGYDARLAAADARRADLAARAQRVSMARVACVALSLITLPAMVWGPVPSAAGWGIIVLSVAAFVALVVQHARLADQEIRAEASCTYLRHGLLRMRDAYRDVPLAPDAPRQAPDPHPYADDLDLVGEGSLLHLLDTTATPFGRKHLAARLLKVAEHPLESANEAQEGVRELGALHELREQCFVLGASAGRGKGDPDAFIAWADDAQAAPLAPALRGVAWGLPATSLTLLVVGQLGLVRALPSWTGLVSLAVTYAVSLALGPRLHETLVATEHEGGLMRYAELFALVERSTFKARGLLRLQKVLAVDGTPASAWLSRLSRAVAFAEARQNDFFRLVLGPLLLWDVHVALSLDALRRTFRGKLRPWFDALGEFESSVALGTFAAENPDYAFPEFAPSPQATFVASSLGHPLLPRATRVANDVAFPPSVVVTGSNMAGKSTLLRTVGVNAVLAFAGAPVCATSLRVSALSVATSMRVRDSVGDGVSRFYAELRKLLLVVQTARAGKAGERAPLLFLLDEVLHGTNARERIIGARALLRELLSCGAIGAVSTHDLELAEFEQEVAAQLRNVHFEEQVDGDKMTFDYRLREGVVQSSNALRLMRVVGFEFI
jgi:hypothetical protein